jgi:hypothetical protein
MARIGKIARLPAGVREELNQRLRNGQLGTHILPWVNGLPEAQAVVAEFFQGQEINAQNLSDWRAGGYKEWEEQQDKTHRIRELAQFAAKLTQANGGSIAEGAAAIASGKLLELLEPAADGAPMDKDTLGDVVQALVALRSAEIGKGRLDLETEKLKRKDEELRLAREKFKRETAELFLKWYSDERAREVAAAPVSNREKIEKLGQLMFGEEWQ